MHQTWLKSEEDILKKSYGNLTVRELCFLLPSHKYNAIVWKAGKLGLQTRVRHNTQNDTYFNIPTLNNCYWAGFIAADGCISKDNTLVIGLSPLDRQHLITFIKQIDFSGRVIDYNYKNHSSESRVVLTSSQIVRDLFNNFNITTKKTLTLRPPNIYDLQLQLAYIKGYIDGDGTIYTIIDRVTKKHRIRIGIVGTSMLLLWIKQIFDRLYPYNRLSDLTNCGNTNKVKQYQISGKRAEEIIRLLLSIDTPFLQRKWLLQNPGCVT